MLSLPTAIATIPSTAPCNDCFAIQVDGLSKWVSTSHFHKQGFHQALLLLLGYHQAIISTNVLSGFLFYFVAIQIFFLPGKTENESSACLEKLSVGLDGDLLYSQDSNSSIKKVVPRER